MHLPLKKEAAQPAAANSLQQQARFVVRLKGTQAIHPHSPRLWYKTLSLQLDEEFGLVHTPKQCLSTKCDRGAIREISNLVGGRYRSSAWHFLKRAGAD
jgi:hypothetical protein